MSWASLPHPVSETRHGESRKDKLPLQRVQYSGLFSSQRLGQKSQFLATYEYPGELTDPGLEQAEQIREGSKHSEHRWIDAY